MIDRAESTLDRRGNGRVNRRTEVIETEATTPPVHGIPRTGTGLASRAPEPPVPPSRAHDPEAFSVPGRVACGAVAAAFAAGVYLAPNLPELFFVRAIFVLGVWVFGQIAVFGRFGRKPAAP